MSSALLLKRLKQLHPKVIDLSLTRVENLLARLGHPERRLPPIIHIAGTNGKGSLVASLRAIFQAAGYRCHVYISPHLVDFAERITLAGQTISDDQLAHYLERAEQANLGENITFFEITTVAAFLAFAEHPADVLLLEVGLGGRLDATNVITNPTMTAITPISLDHQHYLGGSLAEIATEKAGILKPGVPAVIGAQPPEVLEVIQSRAAAINAPLLVAGRDWLVDEVKDHAQQPQFGKNTAKLRLRDFSAQPQSDLIFPPPNLFGKHQYMNAATALMVARRLRGQFPRLDDAALAQGITNVHWPARMQPLHGTALAQILAPDLAAGDEVWLDGGHNAGAGEALVESLSGWSDKEFMLIFGMLETKDPSGFLRPLARFVSEIHTITIPNEPLSLSAEHVANLARDLGMRAATAPSVKSAIASILQRPDRGISRILICGSLYLAGSVLATSIGNSG